MHNITTIGLDLAKHMFQVPGMDREGRAVLRKKLRRGQVLKFFATVRNVGFLSKKPRARPHKLLG